MGTLVVRHYLTDSFARLADHTYVECGTGKKGWSCWGGKTGGKELRRGTGSTSRADRIAQPDEKAGITCYLVNGVCHQAANRILLPARITVRGARGYRISETLFGPYGRTGTRPCRSPFYKYRNTSGDLAECIAKARPAIAEPAPRALSADDKLDWHYIRGVLKIYDQAGSLLQGRSPDPAALANFQVRLFLYMAEFNLGPLLSRRLAAHLEKARRNLEKKRMRLERSFVEKEMDGHDFANAFNRMTIAFEDEMADIMKPHEYTTLFDLEPGEHVVLADPAIVKAIYGPGE